MIINGQKINCTLQDFKRFVLEIVERDIRFQDLNTMKNTMNEYFLLVYEFCIIKRGEPTCEGPERGNLTREINKLKKLQLYWGRIPTREIFLVRFYNYLLSTEKLYYRRR